MRQTITVIAAGLLVVGTLTATVWTASILHNNQVARNKIVEQEKQIDLINQESQQLIPTSTTTSALSPTSTPSTVAPPSDEATKPAANPPQSTNTQTQVAVHKTAADCWIIISNKIYNVSPFLSQHPGGVGAITPYCGQEATIAFQTHGQAGGSNHSSYAYSLLTSYYVAPLSSASGQ